MALFAYVYIGAFSASEDIAQETVFFAWHTRNTLQDAPRLRVWLCVIAQNLAENYFRKCTSENPQHLDRFFDPRAVTLLRQELGDEWAGRTQFVAAYAILSAPSGDGILAARGSQGVLQKYCDFIIIGGVLFRDRQLDSALSIRRVTGRDS